MSEYRRFFVDASAKSGDVITVTGDEYDHLAKVLRMRVGDNVFVCFGDGEEHFCEISSIDKSCALLKVKNSWKSSSENPFETTLYVAVCKGDKNDFVCQKAVELGANEVVFFESRYTVSKIDDKKRDRLQRIALEASKQCGRATVAKVRVCSFKQMTCELKNFDVSAFCYEKESNVRLADVLHGAPRRVALVIGSEGGFSEEEAQAVVQGGGISVTLGKRILRAETAPVYALAVLNDRLTEAK